jgi:ATP-dependent Lon protease
VPAPPKRRTRKKTDVEATPARRTQKLAVTRGDERFEFQDRLPLLPLRDVVVFPYMTIPLLVGRLPSINAIEKAVARDRMLFVTAQKRSEVADPSHDELYRVGTVVRVLQLFRLPDGTMRVLVEGISRCRVERFFWSTDYYMVKVGVMASSVKAPTKKKVKFAALANRSW